VWYLCLSERNEHNKLTNKYLPLRGASLVDLGCVFWGDVFGWFILDVCVFALQEPYITTTEALHQGRRRSAVLPARR
jgi:hypothetical protein